MAEATCCTMAAVRNPAPVALEATVHGQPFKPGWQTLAEQQESLNLSGFVAQIPPDLVVKF